MKPSERIDQIANEEKTFSDVATSTWDYIKAIKQYLDEQHSKDGVK